MKYLLSLIFVLSIGIAAVSAQLPPPPPFPQMPQRPPKDKKQIDGNENNYEMK